MRVSHPFTVNDFVTISLSALSLAYASRMISSIPERGWTGGKGWTRFVYCEKKKGCSPFVRSPPLHSHHSPTWPTGHPPGLPCRETTWGLSLLSFGLSQTPVIVGGLRLWFQACSTSLAPATHRLETWPAACTIRQKRTLSSTPSSNHTQTAHP